ncbi:MAG: hypothetical protein A2252_09230 [Elusimicrobia bacterium RIFOXYA2_FULL_39_19]|nr:MAG: hypothetical protein A2252_09230 [Elusimicrobia bacterium RIFOXYA2_FULL_39_19]
MKICLDHERFIVKPKKEYRRVVSARIATQETDMSLEELTREIIIPNGRTWTPAIFDPQYRENDNWKAQQLFVLDIDHEITSDIALERCRRTGLKPALVYTTFSSITNERFRMVFALDYEITDERVRDVIQTALMTILKECDPGCKDPARMFFGGKAVLHTDYSARIGIPELIESMCLYLCDQDKSHAAREIERFCNIVGLDMVDGLPYIEVLNGQSPDYSSGDSAILAKKPQIHYIYINKGLAVKSPKTIMLHFAGNITTPTKSGNSRKSDISPIRNLGFKKLSKKCQLYRKFINGRYWAYYPELFGMITNLWNVQGARKKFMKAIERYKMPFRSYAKYDWESRFTYCRKSGYKPTGCDKFCPFTQDCKHRRNMIDHVRLCRGMVNVIEEPKLISCRQAEQELADLVIEAIAKKDNGIYVIKAPAGLGKTEEFVKQTKHFTLAAPTHKLKDEIHTRMKNEGKEVITSPKLPELGPEYQEEMAYIDRLYDIGAPKEAAEYMKSIAQKKGIPELATYLDDLDKFSKAEGTVITTHERLMSLETKNDTVIIDEDILPTLLKQGSMKISDFREFETVIKPEERTRYYALLNAVVDLEPETCMGRNVGIRGPDAADEILTETQINTDVLGFLKCDFFIKSRGNRNIIHYIRRRFLPENKNIIILSATANKFIYEQLFGNRVHFSEVERCETVGRIIQYPQKSFSRDCINKNLELMEFAKSFAGNKPVITYKATRQAFGNPIAHFGALNGLDSFSGNNIVIVGTPHVNPTVYSLYAAALGLDTRLGRTSERPEYIPIERNGMEFYFNTFSKGSALREIQLFLIESELEQAIGRARVLRQPCEVTVLSNCPIVGAEFRYFSKENREKMSLKAVFQKSDK